MKMWKRPAAILEGPPEGARSSVGAAARAAQDQGAHHQYHREERDLRRDQHQAPAPRRADRRQGRQRQARQHQRRLLAQVRGEGEQRRRGDPEPQQSDQGPEHEHRREQIGAGGEPVRGLQVLRRDEHERRGRHRHGARAPERAQQGSDQQSGRRVQAESQGGEGSGGAPPCPAHHPPHEHGQRAVVLAAVRIHDEGEKRVRGVAREREEEMIVADERGRGEERHRHHQAPEHEGDRRRARAGHDRRLTATARSPAGPRPAGCA